MVCKLTLGEDNIRLNSRYVRSTKWLDEHEAGAAVYRTFGTRIPGGRLNSLANGLESPVNVSVYRYGNRLLAFGEQGLPWQLNPDTLETLGPYSFEGRLNSASPFGAHPKFDPASGEMLNFGLFFSDSPRLYFYNFDASTLRFRRAAALKTASSVHDFAISSNYSVFYVAPYILDLRGLVKGGQTVIESLHWRPELGSELIVLSRANGSPVARIETGGNYCLHLVSAFERDHLLFVDIVEQGEPLYPQYQPVPALFCNVGPSWPTRLTIDLNRKALVERRAAAYPSSLDFPVVPTTDAGQPHPQFWALGISQTGRIGRKFFDQLVHWNWETNSAQDVYHTRPMQYLAGEPVFIAEPDRKNDALVCPCFDAATRKTSFLVFRAGHVGHGPVAVVHADAQLHLCFHGTFCP
jgi:all-trans-8'-apo-beta-carotenal 15,15'-oxygenase